MTFSDMSSEEWEEIRRHHDEMVNKGRLELQAEQIRECRPPASAPAAANQSVERRLCGRDDMVVGFSH